MKGPGLLAVAALAHSAVAAPLEGAATAAQRAEIAAVATTAWKVDSALLNQCQAQSCALADAAGSSGKTPKLLPEGANNDDYECIMKYNPSVRPLIQNISSIPRVPKQDTGVSTTLFKYLNSLQRPNERKNGEKDHGVFNGACTPNILIFSKGTLEPTEMGITVGPFITKGWDSSWSTHGVDYDNTVSGDFCLGLPGGQVVKDMINQAATRCPQSKLFISGYSEGAMVVRNGVAYADPVAKTHVKGVITFGDPFQGSPIKGYNGPLKEFCKVADGVCGGNFELSTAHLSYPLDDSVAQAKILLKQWAASR